MLRNETADAVRLAATGPPKRKRIGSVVSFASELQQQLPLTDVDNGVAESLTAKIEKQVRSFDKAHMSAYGDEQVDQLGTSLWNLATRLRRETTEAASNARKEVLLSGRVFAFLMLDMAQWSASESDTGGTIKLMKVALKAGRACLDAGHQTFGYIVLQKCAEYSGRLQDLSNSAPEAEANESKRLEANYLVQRVAHAWKESRLDVAEHMYGKIETLSNAFGTHDAENVADVLFEIGKDFASKRDFPMAQKWLDRAYEVLNAQSLDRLSREGVELRLSVLQATVSAAIGLNTLQGRQRARETVSYIASEVGDKPVTLLLELELLNSSPAETFDADAYANVIRRMIRGFSFAESYFKLIVHHIRRLHDKSPGRGCTALDEFLQALRGCDQLDWVEKLIVNRVWMTTTQRDAIEPIEEAVRVLAEVKEPLKPDAAIAAQALIWKKIEANYNDGQFDLAAKWCELGLGSPFQATGSINVAMIERQVYERKLLLCSISRNDLDAARSVFYSMAETTQREPLTRYLVHKVAVRTGDRELAAECLESVCSENHSRQYLYACVADAHQAGDKRCAIAALKMLVAKFEHKAPHPVHLPALLRCAIRLLSSLLDQGDEKSTQDATIQDLCDMFDGVVNAIDEAPTDSDGNRLFEVKELEWFSRTAYNLGLKNTSTWSLDRTVQMLNSCVSIIKRFPSDLAADVAGDLALKMSFCNFMNASALVALARTQDGHHEQQETYRRMRQHITAFDEELQPLLEHMDEAAGKDLLDKLAILFVFDFEGAACLGCWDEMAEIVRKAARCKSVPTYQAMGDCLLRSDAPHESVFRIMRAIINELWSLGDVTVERLMKYNRCLFQATLARNNDNALHLLEETCRMAREAAGAGEALPQEEVEWIAVAAFNEGVDQFGRFEDQRGRQWADKAMSLAQCCDDKKQLQGVLYEKYRLLQSGLAKMDVEDE